MEIRDYNGSGEWSADAIRDRYRKHCERLQQAVALDLIPFEHVAGSRALDRTMLHPVDC